MKENIIYIRTSTEEQNPENQLNDCQELAKKLNLLDCEVVSDKQSAWKDNKEREGFEQIKSLIKTGKIKQLIVWDFDRIYRNRVKFKTFLEYLKMYKVHLHSYRQHWFEDLHKIPEPWNEIVMDLMINIYGHIAEEESNKKSERVKASQKIIKGKTYSKFGKKWGRKGLSKQTIKEIVDLKNSGMSIREIADSVFYWDKNNNRRKVSKSCVHKVLSGGR